MKKLDALLYVCALNALCASSTYRFTSRVPFTHYDSIYCGNPLSVFYSARTTPFNDCLVECGLRPRCKAVNFRRYVDNTCELLFNIDTTTGESGCLYIRRDDIQFTGNLDNGCGCDEDQTCDMETNTCSKSGCPPISTVEFGEVYGNTYTIGSRLVLNCNVGYTPLNESVIECLSSGEWNGSFTCATGICPSGWYSFNWSCFFLPPLDDRKLKFQLAKDFCESKESHVVRIDTHNEWNFLYNTILNLTTSYAEIWGYYSKSNFWVGMTYNLSTSQWHWLDNGDEVSFTNWGPKQPEVDKNESCVKMHFRDDWKWHDYKCDTTALPICRRHARLH